MNARFVSLKVIFPKCSKLNAEVTCTQEGISLCSSGEEGALDFLVCSCPTSLSGRPQAGPDRRRAAPRRLRSVLYAQPCGQTETDAERGSERAREGRKERALAALLKLFDYFNTSNTVSHTQTLAGVATQTPQPQKWPVPVYGGCAV